jgi:hypothetical protein
MTSRLYLQLPPTRPISLQTCSRHHEPRQGWLISVSPSGQHFFYLSLVSSTISFSQSLRSDSVLLARDEHALAPFPNFAPTPILDPERLSFPAKVFTVHDGDSTHLAARAAFERGTRSCQRSRPARAYRRPRQGRSSGPCRDSRGDPLRWPAQLRAEEEHHRRH